MGSKLPERIHKQNPYGKIVIDEILREFSQLHILQGQMVKEWNVWGILELE
jgi:hypothetical protein